MDDETGHGRIWVDVEDLFQYAAANTRPSGIQRVVFEICRSLQERPDAEKRIGFLRHDPIQDGFVSVSFEAIDALHRRLTAPAQRSTNAEITRRDRSADGAAKPGRLRRLAYRLPLELRGPAATLLKSQVEAGRAAVGLGRAAAAEAARMARSRIRRRGAVAATPPGVVALDFNSQAAPGDVLLVLGSSWFHPFYAAMLERVCAARTLRSAVLFYDAIPLVRPEWCQRNLSARFRHWAETLLPVTDIPLAISAATGRDLERFAAREGLALRRPTTAIPMGTGFSAPEGDHAPMSAAATLPAPGSYVLVVSTVEARKNHVLLFRVWRRLLEEMPREAVPTLVFAGRIGWLVEDLVAQLRNTDWLDGKIVLVEDPDDTALEALYRGCRFTVFPSFYEGWGLPVTESLGFGRPCIASNSSALPEAGGTLARYFDPEDGNTAYREIRRAIEDRAGTEEWAAHVAADFVPVGWDRTVAALLDALR